MHRRLRLYTNANLDQKAELRTSQLAIERTRPVTRFVWQSHIVARIGFCQDVHKVRCVSNGAGHGAGDPA